MFDANILDDIKSFYAYKFWCRCNNVQYKESEDPALFLHEELISNPLYKSLYNLFIFDCNIRCGYQRYRYE